VSNSGEKVIRKCTTELAAIDQMLLAAIKQGSAKKRAAITRILELVPGWSRGQCWQRIRYLQKTTELAADAERKSRKTTRSGISVAARRWASAPGHRRMMTGY
jgi:hypothetical protein